MASNGIKFTSYKSKVLAAHNKAMGASLTALGMEAVRAAVTETDVLIYNAPISASGYRRTGRLRASITYQVDRQNKAVVYGSPLNYALYTTMGTRFMQQLPWMQNSINLYTEAYGRVVEHVYKTTFGR